MKIDDRKWASKFTSLLVIVAGIALALAIIGGALGAYESIRVGVMVFTVSLLGLYVVAQPKPLDHGEEKRKDVEQEVMPLAKKPHQQHKGSKRSPK